MTGGQRPSPSPRPRRWQVDDLVRQAPSTPPAGLPHREDIERLPRFGPAVETTSHQPRPYVTGLPTLDEARARRADAGAHPARVYDAATRIGTTRSVASRMKGEIEQRAMADLRCARGETPGSREDAEARIVAWQVAIAAIDACLAAAEGNPDPRALDLPAALRDVS